MLTRGSPDGPAHGKHCKRLVCWLFLGLNTGVTGFILVLATFLIEELPKEQKQIDLSRFGLST